MASACFWSIGSALKRFETSSAVRMPTTAVLTMTMNTISSRSVTPRARLGSARHIAGLEGHVDQARRRVVRDGARQRDDDGRAGFAHAVEAEASHRREHDAVGRGGCLQRIAGMNGIGNGG